VPVTFVARYYGAARGGIGRYEEALYPYLRQAVRADLVPVQPVLVPAPLVTLGRLAGRDLRAFARNHPCWLPSEVADTVVHLSSQTLALALLLRRLRRSVVTVHDIIPYVEMAAGDNSAMPNRIDRWLYRVSIRCLHRATRVIADSAYTKRDLTTCIGLPEERIDLVPLGVDTTVFRPLGVPERFYHAYSLEPGRRYILYVGAYERRKNLRLLLDAFGKLRDAGYDAELLVCGAPRGESETADPLDDALNHRRLQGAVRRLGHVSNDDLVLLYNLSTVFAMPSLYEGFGLPVLEAMACGTPVVASSTTSLPEVVGDAGLLVNPHDAEGWAQAIGRLLDDESLRRDLRQRGLERAHQFTWSRTAQETLRVYEMVLEERV
jgi:glycosyltransferase involved in cell wall biosynthesis